jgi:hypothetical protein
MPFDSSPLTPHTATKSTIVLAADPRAAWQECADDLAHWAWTRLVNRVDAWGGYWREQMLEGARTHPTTRPHPRDRGNVRLSVQVLCNHFAADETRCVIGLHTTSPENTSRWGAVEVDWHGETSTPPEVNFATVFHWYARLVDCGFRPLLTESNGQGGYHLRVLFSEPAPTQTVHRFLAWLIADHAKVGLPVVPEIFPKQPKIRPGGFGNWLRLPGRHHTREHWSRVWNGARWLDGLSAIEFMLTLDGDDAQHIPPTALAPRVTVTIRGQARQRARRSKGDALGARIRAYLAKLPAGLGEGQHRDDYGYTLAAFLVRDLGLPDTDALAWLQEWDARNAVLKGIDRLKELIADAHAYGKHAYGSGLA